MQNGGDNGVIGWTWNKTSSSALIWNVAHLKTTKSVS